MRRASSSGRCVLDEVDLGAADELQRRLVDDELDAVPLEHHVLGLARVVEAEAVLKAGAAAARDGEAQEGVRQVFELAQYRDPLCRALGQRHLSLRGDTASVRHLSCSSSHGA